uniref:(northern house mosquito) hypothetical protein n=1 Tax=Culex pipiens TaxID=7175 RepID=A0A8D8KF05_CULPI
MPPPRRHHTCVCKLARAKAKNFARAKTRAPSSVVGASKQVMYLVFKVRPPGQCSAIVARPLQRLISCLRSRLAIEVVIQWSKPTVMRWFIQPNFRNDRAGLAMIFLALSCVFVCKQKEFALLNTQAKQ